MSEKENQSSRDLAISSTISFKKAAAVLLLAILAFTALRSIVPKQLSKFAPAFTSNIAKQTMATVNGANGTSDLKITKRPSAARGHADHGWLYTFHTFSFASYQDSRFQDFGPLRVINEDRVRKGTGFGKHSHAEFLIFSYIVGGELEHKDSMGNLENLRRGEVQFTSAGTGISHSEFNRNKKEEVHFLQIWAKPNVSGLTPSYKTRKFTDEMKQDKLVRIMESTDRHSGKDEDAEPIPLHSDLSMDASILSPGKSVTHDLVADGERKVYLHVVMTDRMQPADSAKVKIGDVELGEGDGAFVKGAKGPGSITIENTGSKSAEFILFDMGLD